MASVHPYLTFNGNCEEAFLFYKSVFDSEFSGLTRFSELPPFDGKTCPPEDAEKILHVSLPVGNTILMGSDSTETFGGPVLEISNFSISINTSQSEEADHIFDRLSDHAVIKMPMHQSFWGAYFGTLTDKFGINWMINFDPTTIS